MKINARTISRLVNYAFEKFEHNVKARAKILRQVVGMRYVKQRIMDADDKKFSPINLMHNGVYTLVTNLVIDNPETEITCDLLQYQHMADGLEIAGERLYAKINLASTFGLSIMDASMMGIGVVKTGIASTDQWIEGEDEDINVGQPYAQRVDPDDLILDPMARHWDEMTVVGHKMRCPVSLLLQAGVVNKSKAQELPRSYTQNERATTDSAEGLIGDRVEMQVSRDVEDYVDLVEVFLPRERLTICLPYRKGALQTEFLKVDEYEGPERGPYHKLGFCPVPNNVLDCAPATLWMDTHLLANRIGRKITRQAERNKKVLAYTDNAAEDADSIASADDGQTVRVNNLEELKEIALGGATDESYKWFAFITDQFNEQTGNAGTPSTQQQSGEQPTARQVAGQNANKAVILKSMNNAVIGFAQEICSDLIYYLYMDPLIEHASTKETTTIDHYGVPRRITEQVLFDPGEERGEWFHYHVKVAPYSMQRSDPQTDVRNIMEVFTNVIPAMAQVQQQLGPGFVFDEALKIVCQKLGINDAGRFFKQQAFEEWQKFLMQLKMGKPSSNAEGEMVIPEPPTPESLGLPGLGGGRPGQPVPGAMGPTGGKSPQQAQRAMSQPGSMTNAMTATRGISNNMMKGAA